MFNKKFFLLFFAMVLITVISVGCSKDAATEKDGGDGKYVFKFAHEEAPGDIQDKYAQKFKELLNEKSDGKIDVEIYTIGQLGSDLDMIEQLQTGAVDFEISSPGTTGSIVPEAQFIALQYLFSDKMEVNQKVLNESMALNETLAGQYEEKGIKVLDFWAEGFQYWTANKPIKSPKDFKGFKMRTMTSPLMVESFKAYGANPTPVNFAEVYSSLQLNMIDGQENPLFFIKSSNLEEVQKYLINSKNNIYLTSTVVNPDFFNSLPSDIQNMVLETIDELNGYAFDMQKEMNDEAWGAMQESSEMELVEIAPEQREEFKKASLPVRDLYVKEAGGKAEEILNTLTKEIEEAEKEME